LTTAGADTLVEYFAITQSLDQAAADPAHQRMAGPLAALATEVKLRHRYDAAKHAAEFIQNTSKRLSDSGDNEGAAEWGKLAGVLKTETPEAKLAFETVREAIHKGHGQVEEPASLVNTASQSRPKTGLSGALSLTQPAGEH